jgi:alkanesulfonate monooxygenase SsuD/methylene tetrahydromethanopterin reductase-like flavin-dependent oxidoreductase (luciferase family)
MAAATVDHLSNQRFILGLGSSHKVQVEPEHGMPFGKPIQKVRESVAIIRTLLRDGAVSYQGETVNIQRFDLWFTPSRPQIPIYLAGLFPKMLEVCGEIAQGVILTRSTLETGRRVAEHIALGAHRAGRQPEEITITSLLPCMVADNKQEACDTMRPMVAFYGGFFPRYNRLIAENGFPDVAEAIHDAWEHGDREAATRAVPNALIEATGVVGTPTECQERLEAYRRSGIAVPIISLRGAGRDSKQVALETMKACAP